MTVQLDRRAFLATAGAAALIVPFDVSIARPLAATPTRFTAYLTLHEDGTVTVTSPVSEMGQGTHTGHAQIVADELGVALESIRIVMPDQPAAAFRLPSGQMRSVGSWGIRQWVAPLRKASAQARTALVETAAARWQVAAGACDVDSGAVLHRASERKLAYTEILAAAAERPLVEEPALRAPATRRYSGKTVKRIDTPAKINGTAVFGIDIRLPEMLYGAVRLSPVYRAELESFDAASAPGATAIVPVPGGVVVVADSWWKAKQLADGLTIRWKPTPHDALDSATLSARLRAGLDGDDLPVSLRRGDAAGSIARAAKTVQADYEVPFLTHVSMEPITAAARVTDERCELWLSTQAQDIVRMAAERASGLPAEKIFINTTYLGGGFGRKTHGEAAEQAILASKAVGGRPVKVVWAREDDIRQGQYRPTMAARFRAGLTADGRIAGMVVRLSGPQMGRDYIHVTIRDNYDPFSLSVIGDHRYAVSDYWVGHRHIPVPPTLCPWRAVSSSQNGFFFECFMDEMAAAAGQDPLAFRLAHLTEQKSHTAVLRAAAARAGWGTPLPGANWGRGIAMVESYGSRCAQVIDVEMVDDRPVVRRVVVALDCGEVINPGQIEQQMVGSVIEGLGAAMNAQVTLKDGRAEQSNFGDYPILRIDEIPEILVETVDAGSPVGGVGEPGLPPTAPALANAVFAATGRRRRKTPLLSV